jgi:hypothetical protein
MALGYALTLAGALLVPPERCELIVQGIPEPQTVLLRLVDLYRKGALRFQPLLERMRAEVRR